MKSPFFSSNEVPESFTISIHCCWVEAPEVKEAPGSTGACEAAGVIFGKPRAQWYVTLL